METIFIIAFATCFVCFMLRSVFNILKFRKSRWAENKKIVTSIFIVMGILWFSWFLMVLNDPIEMELPEWARYIGLVLFIIGVSLFILSHTKLKGFEDRGHLATKGIYSKIRNPMYLGFILWLIGFPIFMQAFATLVSGIIWIACFVFWKILEEKELEEKYKEYKEYKKRTWF